MNRREYITSSLAAAIGWRGSGARVSEAATGVKVVTDTRYAKLVEERGTSRENWAPAIERAWAEAAAEGSDVFMPAGVYRVRLRQVADGYAPAVDLPQPNKYTSVRILGPARGAEIRIEEWPPDAADDQEMIRVRSDNPAMSGGWDVVTGIAIRNLKIVNRSPQAKATSWQQPHDYPGVGLRLVGIYDGTVQNCFFQGFRRSVALGAGREDGASYNTDISGCRFQRCNEAVWLPPTANGTRVRQCSAVWMNAPTSGPVGVFSTNYSTSGASFSDNNFEQCAGPAYQLGATVNVRISGGRMESVGGAVHVRGTGSYAAIGIQINGLSVDCDSLNRPAIWLERADTTLVTGVTFYQNNSSLPHVKIESRSRGTTLLTLAALGEDLRVSNDSVDLLWLRS